MVYKVAVASKGFIAGFPPTPDNTVPIDLDARVIIVEADNPDEAQTLAEKKAIEQIYEDRGGGPLWLAHAVLCMPYDQEV